MCVCHVAETRHYYPRLERKPAAVPEWDGKCYSIRVPDPAVHSLVPEFYHLRPGLAGPLQGRPAGFQGFVTACFQLLKAALSLTSDTWSLTGIAGTARGEFKMFVTSVHIRVSLLNKQKECSYQKKKKWSQNFRGLVRQPDLMRTTLWNRHWRTEEPRNWWRGLPLGGVCGFYQCHTKALVMSD